MALGVPTLQPNFLNPEDLKKAKTDPERYRDIIVRISGLSAYFVELKPSVQDEIIARQSYIL